MNISVYVSSVFIQCCITQIQSLAHSTQNSLLNFEKHTRITHVQYPHTSIRKWVYDAMDYVDGAPNPYLVISCIPKKLLDTKPRQTRLGHAVMVLGFNNDTANQANLECVAKIGNTREMSYGSYPSNERIYAMQWWDNDSIFVLFCNNTFCITPIACVKHYAQRDLKWSLNYLGHTREQ